MSFAWTDCAKSRISRSSCPTKPRETPRRSHNVFQIKNTIDDPMTPVGRVLGCRPGMSFIVSVKLKQKDNFDAYII